MDSLPTSGDPFPRRANQLSRACIPGISKLPNELLSLIFQDYVDMDCSVWDLVDVCQRWHRVGFATPHLWSTIKMIGGSYQAKSRERCHEGRIHVCYEFSYFSTILNRCGSAPLDIVVEHPNSQGEIEETLACIKFINSPTVISQVRSLEMHIKSEAVMNAWPECFLSASFPRLERLIIGSYMIQSWYENLMQAVSTTSNRLHTLKTCQHAKTVALPDHLWSNVKVLQLGSSLSSKSMDEIAIKCSHLEELDSAAYPWPNLKGPETTFPNLLKASFVCYPSSFRLLHLPAIQSLQTAEPAGKPPPSWDSPLNFVTFSELRSMQIKSSSPQLWLTNVSMDKLNDLKLMIPDRTISPSVLQGTLLETFTTLQTLHLESSADESFVIGLLDLLPSLISFVFTPWFYYKFKELGLKLLPHLSKYDEGFVCSPNLKHLTLGLPGHGRGIQTAKRPFQRLITELIESRAKYNAPLLKLDVFWKGGEEHQNFI
ncbi:hypothetical protein CPB86DRAFT_818381 [Serendipita vermifera]|nr:hypothetical protein CPB86DRAFT_818381 [Serendipita vermifera]